MTAFQAFVLALIQGVTEFLPISSSAHLILVPHFLGWPEHDLRFDVVTNAGTLLAAMVYFRHDLYRELFEARSLASGTAIGAGSGISALLTRLGRPYLLPAVAVGSLPVLLCGYLFYDLIATVARGPLVIASTSIGFGVLLWVADAYARARKPLPAISWRDSVVIGFAEALALIPGTSRSGVTITAGLFLGFNRTDAARFSFLLAIPVGSAALLRDLWTTPFGGLPAQELQTLAIGLVVSGASAYFVIGWLLEWMKKQTLLPFVIYRVLLGLLTLSIL